MLLTQQLAQELSPEHTGVVVNLLDQKLCNPNPDFLTYTLSKPALAQATVLAAQALAPRIRVMGIAPGLSLRSGEQSDAILRKSTTKRFCAMVRRRRIWRTLCCIFYPRRA